MRRKKTQHRRASRQPSTSGGGATLNVVFHGAFAFIIRDAYVEVYAPQLEEHVYIAGNWKEELRLKEERVYALRGVTGSRQRPSMDDKLNVFVPHGFQIAPTPELVFCSLALPFPKDPILSLRRYHLGDKPEKFFGGNHAGLTQQITCLSEVQVFTYDVLSVKDLRLDLDTPHEKHPWEPMASGPNPDVYNLHIFAEPNVDMEDKDASEHSKMAFAGFVRIFQGLNIEMIQPIKDLNPDPGPAPKELKGELEDLVHRVVGSHPVAGGKRILTVRPYTCGGGGGNG